MSSSGRFYAAARPRGQWELLSTARELSPAGELPLACPAHLWVPAGDNAQGKGASGSMFGRRQEQGNTMHNAIPFIERDGGCQEDKVRVKQKTRKGNSTEEQQKRNYILR